MFRVVPAVDRTASARIAHGKSTPALPQIQAGALRPLVATTTRLLPGVPTVATAGLPGYEMGAWQGLSAPPGTLPAIVPRLAEAVRGSLGTAEKWRRLEALSLVPML